VILKNHAGSCDYQLPDWATAALESRAVNTRSYVLAKHLSAYQDVENYPYIHLFDGGITDNLGIRAIINPTLVTGNMYKKLDELDLGNTRKLIVIVVNSRAEQDISFAKRDYSIPLFDTLGVASSIPLEHFSFETMELLRRNMRSWERSISKGRCAEMHGSNRPKDSADKDCMAKTYLIEISFDALTDEKERKHLQNLPTSFSLESADVDRLRAAAKKILYESKVFQSLIKEMAQ
jgi:NTE family protein